MSDTPTTQTNKSNEIITSSVRANIQETVLWYEIRRAAKTNPMLAEALNQVIMLYYLGVKNGD